eukprot:TRINITY_DN4023_c0_g1_i1.p1 TRINITY_DN4023_c0_g1~~TRINITY_DN4023_c0_g1_i1.p1  ORF type:complete len:207 (-),score=24.02 TRINITY_DN4023_c0_g1_i1:43-663(-)
MANSSPNTTNEFDAKVVLLGDSGVGKTSLVMRYVQGTCAPEQNSTIGASFMTKRMFLNNWKVKLQIWDTAGQERFRSMTPMYYRGANAAILVYDMTQAQSFESVKDWVRELNTNVNDEIVIAIAGNKCDLVDKDGAISSQVKEYAESIDAMCFETSALTDRGVEDLFFAIAKRMIENHTNQSKSNSGVKSAVNINNTTKQNRCCGT